MEDSLLRRAGLDYHETARVRRHASWDEFVGAVRARADRMFAFTTRGNCPLVRLAWQRGDWLVFGSETTGLTTALLDAFPPDRRVRLPMRPGQRSLNLSNAVAVAVFEAWRQIGYEGAT
jgi:tRNA (cytidine/uridine-2'-O-)-methyltransferase